MSQALITASQPVTLSLFGLGVAPHIAVGDDPNPQSLALRIVRLL